MLFIHPAGAFGAGNLAGKRIGHVLPDPYRFVLVSCREPVNEKRLICGQTLDALKPLVCRVVPPRCDTNNLVVLDLYCSSASHAAVWTGRIKCLPLSAFLYRSLCLVRGYKFLSKEPPYGCCACRRACGLQEGTPCKS